MIRKHTSDDTDAVVDVWRSASALAHPFLTSSFIETEADNVRHVYMKYAETWVTEIDGKVIGFIAMIDNEIGGLFLDPEHHGRGFGRAMVDKAVSLKGSLNVEVFSQNAIGRKFYAAYGFCGRQEYLHEPSGQMTLKLSFNPK